jgi:V8-like Glu-specific endopeptidase
MVLTERFWHLARGGLATIGAAVAAVGLVNVIGAPEALGQQPLVTKGRMVKSPTSRQAPGEGIDFEHAIPMPLAESTFRPASQAEAMLKAPAAGSAKPWSRGGAPGNGIQRPIVLVPTKQIPDKVPLNGVVPQEFGTDGLPYTTSQVNAFADDTDVHYPFSAAGKLFFNVGTDTFMCSASLIARGIVVTAAHCVANFGQRQFYANWQYVSSYNNGIAPYGVSTAKSAIVLPAYFEGTDPCAQAGVICQDDVAIITLNPLNDTGTYAGTSTGWLGVGADGYGFTASGLTQITQLGYPGKLDGGQLMERNDSQGYVEGTLSNNTIIGSLMTEGTSGGPWVVNLGIPPSLSGTSFGQSAVHNVVVGVTSWGLVEDDTKHGASPFTSGNVLALLQAACGATPAACQ